MNTSPYIAIVIGDSTHNTLSAIRSLGESEIEQYLILKCEEDTCFVARSKYLKGNRIHHIQSIDECLPIIEKMKELGGEKTIICTFDEAAVFIDSQEEKLTPYFRTPAKGNHIGSLFNKDEQCKLAIQCGLTVPRSQIFHRTDKIDSISIDYPILLKPLYSTKGEKSDIHICHTPLELESALKEESHCEDFILQEFINKEYELDCIGVRTENGVFISGAVRKIRHYPYLIGAGAYGLFLPLKELDINIPGLERFLKHAGYYGPFSVEFLHRGNKNYFMEVNFRNEGLAYASTVAGANLHAFYVNPSYKINWQRIRKTYMMNYSIDFLYVKNGDVALRSWLKDFMRTRCFINFNRRDPMPVICYYLHKIKKRFQQ